MDKDWYMLRDAIIVRACDDYKAAFKSGNVREQCAVKRFFFSDWFDLLVLGNVDPNQLIRHLEEGITHD